MKSILKNWRTTLAGQAGGILAALGAGLHNPDGSYNLLALGLYVAFSAFGAAAKDGSVTGGTVAATPEAQGRLDSTQ